MATTSDIRPDESGPEPLCQWPCPSLRGGSNQQFLCAHSNETTYPRQLCLPRVRERGAAIRSALDIAIQYGQDDGAHHKAWVIDQMVRALAGDGYDALIAEACAGEDGPDTYSWDTGVAP